MSEDLTIRLEIEAQVARFVALINGDDVDAFAALYTEDALIMVPDHETLVGLAGAVQFARRAQARRPARLALVTHEVGGSGNMAWERGSSQWVAADGTVLDPGKYVVIWRRTNRGWQLHRDIMNADRPTTAR
ncbi:YybH family protein [Vineibacter terrae]|uniref:YybH family protein n=1 Tax=Vineibacter terrae TaxID=2586908 RepID=UPI0015B4EB6C|nr:DUF4440 domain-containing protein [Vineibacter terrae]